jgi:hypothetical protein
VKFIVHYPDDEPREFELAPLAITRAIQRRFDDHRPVVCHPTLPCVFIYDPGNFWDGPTHVQYWPEFGHFEFSGWDGDQHFPLIGPLC